MLVSHDTTIKYMFKIHDFSPQVMKKDEVTDTKCSQILKLCGLHQTSVDFSRCPLLKPNFFDNNLKLCENISYLDVSFTQFESVDCLYSLPSLQSLVLSGTSIAAGEFDQLSGLTNLQALSLRSTAFSTSLVLKDFEMLRSLDLGETKIRDIGGLGGCSRLEELALDNCKQLRGQECIADSLYNLSQLKNIRLLNIWHTELEQWIDQLLDVVPRETVIETTPRRLMFFEAVINNNVHDAQWFLNNGQDINMRLGHYHNPNACTSINTENELSANRKNIEMDQRFLVKHWQLRGLSKISFVRCGVQQYFSKELMGRQRGKPYEVHADYDPDAEAVLEASTSSLMPSALHLAIIFNSVDVLQMLLAMGADTKAMVWFSDVVEVPATTLDASTELFPDLSSKASSSRPTTSASTGSSQSLSPQSPSALLENTRLSVKRARKIFTPRQLIDEMFERNVHRITDGLQKLKVSNWKEVVEYSMYKLIRIYKGMNIFEESDAPPEFLYGAQTDEKKADAETAGTAAEGEGVEGGGEVEDLDLIEDNEAVDEDDVAVEDPMVPPPQEVDNSASAALQGSPSVAKKASLVKVDVRELFNNYRNIHNYRELVYFNWRRHSMVEKLVGEPISTYDVAEACILYPDTVFWSKKKKYVKRTVVDALSHSISRYHRLPVAPDDLVEGAVRADPARIRVCGKRSYWLESREHTVRSYVEANEPKWAIADAERRKNEYVYDGGIKEDNEGEGIVHRKGAGMRKVKPLPASDETRKQDLQDAINQRLEERRNFY